MDLFIPPTMRDKRLEQGGRNFEITVQVNSESKVFFNVNKNRKIGRTIYLYR